MIIKSVTVWNLNALKYWKMVKLKTPKEMCPFLSQSFKDKINLIGNLKISLIGQYRLLKEIALSLVTVCTLITKELKRS